MLVFGQMIPGIVFNVGAVDAVFMFTVTVATCDTHPDPVQLIFAIPFPVLPVITPPVGFGMEALPAINCVFDNL